MKPTHEGIGVSLAQVDSGWAIEVAAKGPQRLLIALTDAQLRGLARLIQSTLPPPQGQSDSH